MKLMLSACGLAILLTSHIAQPQTSSTPGQTTNGPCSPIFNGSGNTVSCNTPPPGRFILQSDADLAITRLRQSSGTKVDFTKVGATQEIGNFLDTIIALFRAGHWEPVGLNTDLHQNIFINGHEDHGEGVRCSGSGPAFENAKAALALAKHPCIGDAHPSTQNADPTVVYIQVGTRIVPQD